MGKTRFNFQLDDNLREWLQKQAELYGVSLGAMVNICISQYKDYCTMMKQLPDIMKMVDTISKLESKESKEKKGDVKE